MDRTADIRIVQTSEDSSLTDKALKAVKLIAEARGSLALQSWLSTGELGETTMDIGEAYRQFGIDDRTMTRQSLSLRIKWRCKIILGNPKSTPEPSMP